MTRQPVPTVPQLVADLCHLIFWSQHSKHPQRAWGLAWRVRHGDVQALEELTLVHSFDTDFTRPLTDAEAVTDAAASRLFRNTSRVALCRSAIQAHAKAVVVRTLYCPTGSDRFVRVPTTEVRPV